MFLISLTHTAKGIQDESTKVANTMQASYRLSSCINYLGLSLSCQSVEILRWVQHPDHVPPFDSLCFRSSQQCDTVVALCVLLYSSLLKKMLQPGSCPSALEAFYTLHWSVWCLIFWRRPTSGIRPIWPTSQ